MIARMRERDSFIIFYMKNLSMIQLTKEQKQEAYETRSFIVSRVNLWSKHKPSWVIQSYVWESWEDADKLVIEDVNVVSKMKDLIDSIS